MSLGIVVNGANAPDNSPVFGNLLYTDSMQLCVRTSSIQNFHDLSTTEQSLTLAGNDQQFISRGFGYKGTSYAKIDNLSFLDLTDYSIQAVVAYDQIDLSVSRSSNTLIVGDFLVGRISTCLVLAKNSATNKPEIRAFFGCYDSSNGSLTYYSRTFVLPDAVATNTSGSLWKIKPIFVCMSLKADYVNNIGYTDLYIKSLQYDNVAGSTFTPSTASIKFDTVTKKAHDNMNGRVNGVGGSTDNFTNTNSPRGFAKEVRIDSVYLDKHQIEDQYQATKKWLLAEGVLDINHWR